MKNIKNFLSVLILVSIVLVFILLYSKYVSSNLSEIGIETKRNNYNNQSDNYYDNFIALVIIVPVVEEILYRLGLKFSVKNTSFFILGILYTLFLFISPSNLDYNNPIILLSFLTSIIVGYFLIRFFVKRNSQRISLIYAQKFKIIFAISVIVFAYSHFTLYENYNTLHNLIFSPIILFPYFVAGVLFGFIRIKFGLLWGCLAHMIWNFAATIL